MKSVIRLVEENGLRKTDAIIMKKRFFGMVDHYVLFMGYRGEMPVFLGNYRNGVNEVSYSDLRKYLAMMEPDRIEYFVGNESQRKMAEKRAWAREGENAYNYLVNNCEHYKNWVHFGKSHSSQVNTAGNVALVAGAGIAVAGLASKNKTVAYIGLGALLLGALLKVASDE
jgi:hypothetical protein